MFCSETIERVARKQHRCSNCGEHIPKGSVYAYWTAVDDAWTTSRMHPECLQSLQEDADYGTFEYSPYSGERPR